MSHIVFAHAASRTSHNAMDSDLRDGAFRGSVVVLAAVCRLVSRAGGGLHSLDDVRSRHFRGDLARRAAPNAGASRVPALPEKAGLLAAAGTRCARVDRNVVGRWSLAGATAGREPGDEARGHPLPALSFRAVVAWALGAGGFPRVLCAAD